MNRSVFDPDRRIVYVLLLLVMAIPLIKPLGLPIPVSAETRQAYDYIAGLSEDSRVLVAFSYGPSVAAELTPQANIVLNHLAKKGIRTYGLSESVEGDQLAANIVADAFAANGRVRGDDYLYFGYMAGGEAGLAAFSDSISSVFATDSTNTPLSQLPMMTDVNQLADFDLVIAFNGSGVAAWVRQAHTKNGVPLIFGVMGVMASGTVPYLQSGQAVGMLTGAKGAAEYEAVMELPGPAMASMDAQSMSQLLIIAFIVLGNIGYFLGKKSTAVQGVRK